VRPAFGKVLQAEARKSMGLPVPGFVLGVMGGSQGARTINTSILSIANRHRKLTIIWSAGRNNYDKLSRDVAGLSNIHLYPFVDDMAAFLSASNLVISRAGATSLAELAACQTPSILVPYPYASDDHQRRNARAWEEAGAAVVAAEGQDFTEILENILDALVGDRKRLAQMCKAASRLHDSRTLVRMADLVEEVVYSAQSAEEEKKKDTVKSRKKDKGKRNG
jgi:UDP-N-acetylglucosamine--N-acetylmuramyl-(pentapeptide) pyrophosphoryl-undecaprenol N-acetylglucosamine transferase